MAFMTHKRRPNDGIPTSSMADIAFLLLIFFLVTTVFPKDRGLALALPHETGDVPAVNVLFFLIEKNGDVEVRQGESRQSQRITTEEVDDIWRQIASENPLLIAAVKTHPEAAYERMVSVLDALHTAGARRISLQVLPN